MIKLELNYVILFNIISPPHQKGLAIALTEESLKEGTQPHGFDYDLVPTLPALWYCLRLPRSILDTFDLPLDILRRRPDIRIQHNIHLIPIENALDENVCKYLANSTTIIFTPDEFKDLAQTMADRIRPLIGVEIFSNLNEETLQKYWMLIANSQKLKWKRLTSISQNYANESTRTIEIPLSFLVRQLRANMPDSSDIIKLLVLALKSHSMVEALYHLENGNFIEEEASGLLPDLIKDVAKEILINITLACPGVTRSSEKLTTAHYDLKDKLVADSKVENEVIDLLATHNACGVQGIALKVDPLPKRIFQIIDQIEIHCQNSRKPDSKFIWKLLRQLGNDLADHLGPYTCKMLTKARSVHSFCEAPLGLTILPGCSAPLACQVSLIHRPVVPLTRALQLSISPNPVFYFKAGFNLLIAECLSESDPIHELAQHGWNLISDLVHAIPGASCDIVHITSPEELNKILMSKPYAIMIISGHGFYDRKHRNAGINIGKTHSIGLELSHVPPVVIISACHASPRGHGAVTIGDVLLGKGAIAVLSTLIPVNVYRNSLLMTRLFVYIQDTISNGGFRTLADIWMHTMASNAVNEIVSTTDAVMLWSHTGGDKDSVISKFMNEKSVNRLRRSHIYEDSELILQEMADERGFGKQFRNALNAHSYFPESLFYYFLGQPDRIVFHDEIEEKLRERLTEFRST